MSAPSLATTHRGPPASAAFTVRSGFVECAFVHARFQTPDVPALRIAMWVCTCRNVLNRRMWVAFQAHTWARGLLSDRQPFFMQMCAQLPEHGSSNLTRERLGDQVA